MEINNSVPIQPPITPPPRELSSVAASERRVATTDRQIGTEDSEQSPEPDKLKESFTDFVGNTLFGSMLASMRKTVGKPAYMHGGRTEEVFQKQLDQIMVDQLTEASAEEIAQPMFDLFQIQRRA
ncbi:MAG: rod-binding protein [Planctomycetota bacterium]